MNEAVGVIELTSVGIGYMVEDTMLKAADVRILIARTICSGKFLVVIGGSVASVEAAMEAGLAAAPEGVIDHVTIPRIHPEVFAALGQMVQLSREGNKSAVGIIETFSATSALAAADIAAKAASVTLYKIHIAMALGGKGLVMMAGTVADCDAAVEAGAAYVKQKGLLVSSVVISRPSEEILKEYL